MGMFRILAVTALARASDVDLLNFDDSSDALSLIQLRASSSLAHSEANSEGQPKNIEDIWAYDLPDGWRLGFGTGERKDWGGSLYGTGQEWVDFGVYTLEACVAKVQADDGKCAAMNGVSWGHPLGSYPGKCICERCWNPVPQAWTYNHNLAESWDVGYSTGVDWITAGPGTLDPSKYSAKRRAAIQAYKCGKYDENYDPLLGFLTTTTTTTPADPPGMDDLAVMDDHAEAVGDPHLKDAHGKKEDLCCEHGICRACGHSSP